MTWTCILPEYCALLVNRNVNLQLRHLAGPEEDKYAVVSPPAENRVLTFHPAVGLCTDRPGIAARFVNLQKLTDSCFYRHCSDMLTYFHRIQYETAGSLEKKATSTMFSEV
jgi:hypothetical protein